MDPRFLQGLMAGLSAQLGAAGGATQWPALPAPIGEAAATTTTALVPIGPTGGWPVAGTTAVPSWHTTTVPVPLGQLQQLLVAAAPRAPPAPVMPPAGRAQAEAKRGRGQGARNRRRRAAEKKGGKAAKRSAPSSSVQPGQGHRPTAKGSATPPEGPAPPGVCFQCWKPGHRRAECSSATRGPYCHGCGWRGRTVDTCPRCCVRWARSSRAPVAPKRATERRGPKTNSELLMELATEERLLRDDDEADQLPPRVAAVHLNAPSTAPPPRPA